MLLNKIKERTPHTFSYNNRTSICCITSIAYGRIRNCHRILRSLLTIKTLQCFFPSSSNLFANCGKLDVYFWLVRVCRQIVNTKFEIVDPIDEEVVTIMTSHTIHSDSCRRTFQNSLIEEKADCVCLLVFFVASHKQSAFTLDAIIFKQKKNLLIRTRDTRKFMDFNFNSNCDSVVVVFAIMTNEFAVVMPKTRIY